MSTKNRVPKHTNEEINQEIHQRTVRNLQFYLQHPEQIPTRLQELDEEWDIERVLETNAAGLSLAGLILGLTVNRRWLLLPLTVQLFFMQHALQGWCPPLPILRRLGVRTADEINYERYALKAIRGDFKDLTAKGELPGAEQDSDKILRAMMH